MVLEKVEQTHFMSENCYCEQKRDVLPRFCVAIFLIVHNCVGDCFDPLWKKHPHWVSQ
jgi:hypothetical protein